MYGWAGTILRVDLAKKKIAKEIYSEELRRNFIGGRGVNAKILYDEVPRGIDPLGSENKLILGTGPFTGSVFGGNSRWNATAKSPLTGIFGDGNGGGHWAAELKFAGYDHIIVQGVASGPVYLWIDDDRVEIRDAGHLWGHNFWEAENTIKKELGDPRIRVLGIGQGGENLVRFAMVMCDHSRAAGRPGLGAVMGSRKLKAIAVRGTKGLKVARPEVIEGLLKKWYRLVAKSENPLKQKYMKEGTSCITRGAHDKGMLTAGYFEGTSYIPEELESLAGDTFVRKYKVKTKACFACPFHCSHYYRVKEGHFAGVEGEGPEYENITTFGGRIHNTYMPSILYANNLSNQYGLDTTALGNVISMAYYFYEKGIITDKDTDGLKLQWGKWEPMIELIHKIVRREGIGDILAEGEFMAARKIREGAEDLVMHSKGMGAIAWEPRGMKGSALTFATSTRGFDHLRGLFFGEYRKHLAPVWAELFGSGKVGIPTEYDSPSKAKGAVCVQHLCAVRDAVELCQLCSIGSWFNEPSLSDIAEVFTALTGIDADEEYLMKCGERIWNVEKAFNVREGCLRKDDTFGSRTFTEPLPDGPFKGEVLDKKKFDKMLDAYYTCRGWDVKTSIPGRKKLEDLGLGDIADDLEKLGEIQPQKGPFAHQIFKEFKKLSKITEKGEST